MMARPKTQPEALTVGQLASRWNVSPDRVRSLVDNGRLPGAFQIPSAGRYGATIKIPLAVIIEAEQHWAVVPAFGSAGRTAALRRNHDRRVVLKHFPHLNGASPPDSESREAAPH